MKLTLSSKNYHAVVNTTGAELKSFTTPEGQEFIWTSDPNFWERSSPLLFPTIGNVRNGITHFDGKEYPLMKHGFCKDSEFQVLDSGEDFVTFSLKANEDTRKHYPFEFEVQLTYHLNGPHLGMSYEVFHHENSSPSQTDSVMPYHLGAHPGITCPLYAGESLSDYQLEFEQEERLESTVYDLEKLCFSTTKKVLFDEHEKVLPLNGPMFDNDAVYFPHTRSHSVKLVNPKTGKGVCLDYPGFVSIAFWTPIGGNAPFLCLEPWNGAAIYEDEDDEFCHKRDVELLKPGQSKKYELGLTLLDGNTPG